MKTKSSNRKFFFYQKKGEESCFRYCNLYNKYDFYLEIIVNAPTAR